MAYTHPPEPTLQSLHAVRFIHVYGYRGYNDGPPVPGFGPNVMPCGQVAHRLAQTLEGQGLRVALLVPFRADNWEAIAQRQRYAVSERLDRPALERPQVIVTAMDFHATSRLNDPAMGLAQWVAYCHALKDHHHDRSLTYLLNHAEVPGPLAHLPNAHAVSALQREANRRPRPEVNDCLASLVLAQVQSQWMGWAMDEETPAPAPPTRPRL